MDRLFKIRVIIFEMLKDRGHLDFKNEYDTLEKFSNIYPKNLNIELENLKIYFVLEKLKKPLVQILNKDLDDIGINNAIIISEDITSPTKKYILNVLNTSGRYIEIFLCNELTYNPFRHILVPKHRILSLEEKFDILKIYKTEIDNFPKIKTSDKIVRYLGAKKNDMLEIIRLSESNGYYKYYRLVIF